MDIKIYKESGNTHVKNTKGESVPITHGLYLHHDEAVDLKTLMMLLKMNLKTASDMVDGDDIYLSGHTFQVKFLSEESANSFMKMLEEIESFN